MAIKKASDKYPGVYINEYKNGNIAYYINYRNDDGKPTLKKVGLKTQQSNFTIKDAYDRLIEVKHKLSTGEELPKVVEKKSKNIFFSDLYEEYEKWAKNNNTSWELDKGIYNNHLDRFHQRNIKTIRSQDFEDLKNEKLKEFSPRTVENILRLAKAIYNHALKIDYVKKLQNPLSNGRVKFPKVDNKQLGYLKQDEAQKILYYFSSNNFPRLYQLSALMLFTGARFVEIVSLTWDDLNFRERLIYFKKTKDGDDRFIKMSDRVYEVLQDLQNEKNKTKLVIPNAIGTQYKQMPKQWQDNVDKIFPNNVNLGKNRITPHSLRHTHASWLAQKGVNILHIKKQLGHKKLETTMRYAHISDKHRYQETLDIAF